jgi:hypothetical protein
MKLGERQKQLDTLLPQFQTLWHPQPFREYRPEWCEQWPALADRLLGLSDADAAWLNEDSAAAISLLAEYQPEVSEILAPSQLLPCPAGDLSERAAGWAWEIPGRKQVQIEAFVRAVTPRAPSVIDWCGGKGHLGRLLALEWGREVHTLEIDQALCDDGQALANRLRLNHHFLAADALTVTDWPKKAQHAVALHACGDLHRRLLTNGVSVGASRMDVAPCCYYRGVSDSYQALSGGVSVQLSRDDLRLAVTETVTASPRLTRQRDKEMAWKLGFDAYQRGVTGNAYKPFKSVPAPWFRTGFAEFLGLMAERAGLPLPGSGSVHLFEESGWRRQAEVIRLSIVRHAFRRAIEVWLALDLAIYLENNGYTVALGSFCERRITPRNLLISAQLGA